MRLMRFSSHLPLPGVTGGRAAPGAEPLPPLPRPPAAPAAALLLAPLADALLSWAATATKYPLHPALSLHVHHDASFDIRNVSGQALAPHRISCNDARSPVHDPAGGSHGHRAMDSAMQCGRGNSLFSRGASRATPTCAVLRAPTSLVPSPHIRVIHPVPRRTCSMRSFWSGVTLANTCTCHWSKLPWHHMQTHTAGHARLQEAHIMLQ